MSRTPGSSPPSPARSGAARPDGLPAGYSFRPEWEVTPRYTAERLAAGGGEFILLDCRRPDEHQIARIEGSVLIPMDEIERRADELEDDDGRRDRQIVVHCHHGARSLRVAATLRALGFSKVHSMAGGIEAWSTGVDARVPRY